MAIPSDVEFYGRFDVLTSGFLFVHAGNRVIARGRATNKGGIPGKFVNSRVNLEILKKKKELFKVMQISVYRNEWCSVREN